MRFVNPFEFEGNWYKGNLHSHTTNSDGSFSPEKLCEIYQNAGYDFLCLTDHHKITSYKTESSQFITIPGAELNNNENGNFHIVAFNLKEIFECGNLKVQEIIDRVKKQNALAFIAHPYWSAISSYEITKLRNFDGIEVFNTLCEIRKGKGYSSIHWDELITSGRRINGVVGDDGHGERDIIYSFIMVKAKSFTVEEIQKSIEKGLFYSSTGVIVEDLKIERNEIKIKTSPAIFIDFISYNGIGSRVYSGKGVNLSENEEITYATCPIKGKEKYIRIEITDKYGRKAWINPLFL